MTDSSVPMEGPIPSVFALLVRVHDHIWRDQNFTIGVRRESCDVVWKLAREYQLVKHGKDEHKTREET